MATNPALECVTIVIDSKWIRGSSFPTRLLGATEIITADSKQFTYWQRKSQNCVLVNGGFAGGMEISANYVWL